MENHENPDFFTFFRCHLVIFWIQFWRPVIFSTQGVIFCKKKLTNLFCSHSAPRAPFWMTRPIFNAYASRAVDLAWFCGIILVIPRSQTTHSIGTWYCAVSEPVQSCSKKLNSISSTKRTWQGETRTLKIVLEGYSFDYKKSKRFDASKVWSLSQVPVCIGFYQPAVRYSTKRKSRQVCSTVLVNSFMN